MTKLKIILLILLALLNTSYGDTAKNQVSPKTITVGAFDNYPSIFRDEHGIVRGIWVDVLSEVAAEENWTIRYSYGTWQDCINGIKDGSIDLLAGVAYTEARDSFMDFNKNYLLTMWSGIYVKEDAPASTVIDLRDKKIGVLKGDYNAESFLNMIKSFQLKCQVMEYDNFESIFRDTENGILDAGVVNNIYGSSKSKQFGLQETAIVFNPFDIYFASPEGKNKDILTTLDSYIAVWKPDVNSPFHNAVKTWTHYNLNVVKTTPKWITTLAIVLLSVAVISLLFIVLLKKRIKTATSKLLESEERYSLALKATNDGLFDWDLTNNKVRYSDRWKAIAGYKQNELKNEFATWEKITHPEDSKNIISVIEELIKGKKERAELHFRIKHKKGNWIDILSKINIVYDHEGKAVRIVGAHTDVTEQKQAELKLGKSLEDLKNAQSMARLGNWSYDSARETFEISEEIIKIFDNESKNLPESIFDLAKYCDEKEGENLLESLNDAINNGINFDLKTIIKTNQDRQKWIHIICSAERIKNSDKFLLRGTIQDITAQTKAEIALHKSEKQYKSLYNNIPLGVFRSTIDGRIISVNESMYKLYGYASAEEFMQVPAQSLYLDPGQRDELIERLKKEKYLKNFITREYKKDGSMMWVRCNYIALPDENGNLTHVEGVMEDITSQKIYEDAVFENEKKYRQLYNKTPVMLHSIDELGNIISVSDYWLETLGYTREEVLGKKPTDFFTGESAEKTQKVIMPEFKRKGFVKNEPLTVVKKSGEEINVLFSSIMEYDSNNYNRSMAVLIDITDKTKTELALMESEELFRQTFDYAANGISLMSLEGKFIKVNSAFANMLGYKKEELLEKSFYDITHPDDIKPGETSLKKVKEGNLKNVGFEKRYFTKTGDTVWCFISVSLLNDAANNPLYFISQTIDITEQKKNEESLRKNLESLRQAERIANLGYFEKNWKTGKTYWSRGFYKLLGFDEYEHFLDKADIREYIHVEDRSKALPLVEKNEAPKENLSIEFRVVRQDGSIIHINGIINTIYDESGNPEILQGTFQDITNRKEYESELTTKQKLLDSIVDNIPVMITRYDPYNQMLLLNKEMEKVTGYSSADAQRSDFLERVYPEPEIRDAAVAYMQQATIEWREFIITGKTGEKILSEWSNIRLIDGTQVGIGIDIRSRKNAEKAVVESQRLGAIGEMAAAIAHDFNNSLQSIYGNVELALLNAKLPDAVKKYLETIRTATSDASTRVKLLQRFGGNSNIQKEYSSIDINNIIKDVIVQSRPVWKDQAEKNGIKITITTDYGKTVNFLGNESEIRSVLYNIIKNSVEAMPEGGNIKISTGMSNGLIKILLKDNGKGMDDQIKSRIFQPFFTTKGFEAGRGLGMSGAYSIIKEHGGDLSVKESEPGKGTSMKITLPVQQKETEPEEDTPEVDVELKDARILWVDDDDLIREVAREMLNAIGHHGDIAESGEKALKLLEENSYDLVVTDLGMPGMNGWELISRINEKYNNEQKIAVLTGWGAQLEKEKLERHHITYVLSKPFKMNQLKVFIANVLGDTQ